MSYVFISSALYAAGPPIITLSPNSLTVDRGDNVTFTCTIYGEGNLTIIWLSPAGSILTATNQQMPDSNTLISFLSIVDISGTEGGEYICQASNEAGSTDATAVLFIRPIIFDQPMEIFASTGEMASLVCNADGFPLLFYQWQKLNDTLDGMFSGSVSGSGSGSGIGSGGGGITDDYVNIENATDRMLEFNPIQFGDEGSYRCIVSNPLGTGFSEAATVTGIYA